MASNPTRRLLMTTDLLTCLATIPDRRRAVGKMYGQAGVILFSILAMVSGARSYRQIHTVIDRRLRLPNAAFPGAALRPAPANTQPPADHQRGPDGVQDKATLHHTQNVEQTHAAAPPPVFL